MRSVYVAEAQGGSGSFSRIFAGVVEEDATINLGFKTAGEIKKIFVKEGTRVSAGQLLAELDDADYKLGVEALEVQYEQVRNEVERARRLMEKKSMADNDYEKAEAGLKQLAVQLQVNKNKLAYTRLYAPTDGVIEQVNFSKGEMVDAGTAVFSMISSGRMEVVCDISAAAYRLRNDFTGFQCAVASGDSISRYPMTLLSIIPKADGNQLYRMRLGFNGAVPSALTPGMNVEVAVEAAEADSAVMVPLSAVFIHEGQTSVWVLQNDSTVERTAVTVAPEPKGKMAEISSGLSAGSKVVSAGVSALQQGEKVKVIGKPSETNVGNLL